MFHIIISPSVDKSDKGCIYINISDAAAVKSRSALKQALRRQQYIDFMVIVGSIGNNNFNHAKASLKVKI